MPELPDTDPLIAVAYYEYEFDGDASNKIYNQSLVVISRRRQNNQGGERENGISYGNGSMRRH